MWLRFLVFIKVLRWLISIEQLIESKLDLKVHGGEKTKLSGGGEGAGGDRTPIKVSEAQSEEVKRLSHAFSCELI